MFLPTFAAPFVATVTPVTLLVIVLRLGPVAGLRLLAGIVAVLRVTRSAVSGVWKSCACCPGGSPGSRQAESCSSEQISRYA